MDSSPLHELNRAIAGCQRCPARLVEYNWLPVAYFGNYTQANSWIVSINPSHREFLNAAGQLLAGPHSQRFSVLADDPRCATRETFADLHMSTISDQQDNYYRRNPYRGFFSRLGAFLLEVHGVAASEPLTPFRDPLPDKTLYCHLDIAKCATKHLWFNMDPADRTLVRRNCQSFLAEQLRFAPQLRLILVNGKTAMEGVREAFSEIGFAITSRTVPLQANHVTLWVGNAPQYPAVRFLGWSANVVNGHLTNAERRSLAELVQTEMKQADETIRL